MRTGFAQAVVMRFQKGSDFRSRKEEDVTEGIYAAL
jgi:hypothetical protein